MIRTTEAIDDLDAVGLLEERLEMPDITALILADHNWFRAQFAKLDNLQAQRSVDTPHSSESGVHSATSSTYTRTSRRRSSTPNFCSGAPTTPKAKHSTPSAITTTFATVYATPNAAPAGTEEWWAAVGRTRVANDDHMGEEEREGLSDFRRHAPIGLREALGRQYSEFMAQHPTTKGLTIVRPRPRTLRRGIREHPTTQTH